MRRLVSPIALACLCIPGLVAAQGDRPSGDFVVPPRYRKLADLRPGHFDPAPVSTKTLLDEQEITSTLGIPLLFRRQLLAMREHLLEVRELSSQRVDAIVSPLREAEVERWKKAAKVSTRKLVELDTALRRRLKESEEQLPTAALAVERVQKAVEEQERHLRDAESKVDSDPAEILAINRRLTQLNRELETRKKIAAPIQEQIELSNFYGRIARDWIVTRVDGEKEAKPSAKPSGDRADDLVKEAAAHWRSGEAKKLLAAVDDLLEIDGEDPAYLFLALQIRASRGRLFNRNKALGLIERLHSRREVVADSRAGKRTLGAIIQAVTGWESLQTLSAVQEDAKQLEKALRAEAPIIRIYDKWWVDRNLDRLRREVRIGRGQLARLRRAVQAGGDRSSQRILQEQYMTVKRRLAEDEPLLEALEDFLRTLQLSK